VGTDQGPVRAQVSQFIYGSSAPDGGLHAVTPGVYNDNGAGIDDQYETTSQGRMLSVCQIHGFNLNARGEADRCRYRFSAARHGANDWGRIGKLEGIEGAPGRPQARSVHRNLAHDATKLNERWRVRLTTVAAPTGGATSSTVFVSETLCSQ